jgi:threonine/homoserine/homoserine lactone efflux protein
MDLPLLLRGIVIGFSIAAPVGPIGVLCIRRTLAEGRLAGLLTGLGAATADALYGCLAAFGLTFISSFLVRQQQLLAVVGGVFLCYLGVRTFLSVPSEETPIDSTAILSGEKGQDAAESEPSNSTQSLLGMYASTFFLTLTNPLTILSFAAIYAGMGLAAQSGGYLSAALLVLGVFLGSASWWLLLSGVVSIFRSRISTRGMRWVNRISGAIILGFGLFLLANLFKSGV